MSLPVTSLPQLVGDKGRAVLHEEAMRKLANDRRHGYEAHEFTIPSPTTKISINSVVNHATSCSCGRASGFLGLMGRAARVSIRNTGSNLIVVAYNLVTNDYLTIEDGESHDWDFTEITDIFFTNAGVAVPVRVLAA